MSARKFKCLEQNSLRKRTKNYFGIKENLGASTGNFTYQNQNHRRMRFSVHTTSSAAMFRNLSFCDSDSPIRSKPCEFKFCLTECFLETTLNWLDQLKARRITQPMKGQRILPAFVKRS
jgi:hypothetical protein